ncbi:agouti signaling protein 1 isoform X2 [Latimeria chalumnae]|uniref:agouti signaling protein 1 isoform X2 n=1 Tax=Latimeria chalumnae TaxID=7897 RepID=UPI00313EADBE
MPPARLPCLGAKDIERHSTTEMHKKAVHCLKGQMKTSFFQPKDDIADKVITAEVKNAIMMAHHNTALCLADHLTPMIHSNFPDSDIAKLYKCGRTKTACILNYAVAPYLSQELVKQMKSQPFSPC